MNEKFKHEPHTYENHPDFNKLYIRKDGIPAIKVYTCNELSDKIIKKYNIETLGGENGEYPTSNEKEVLSIPLQVIFDTTGKNEIDLKIDPEITIKKLKSEN